MTDLLVSIGGLSFRGFGDADDYGYWIAKGGWEGWETAPAARGEDSSRPLAHGTTDGAQYLDAREIVMTGFFRAPTAEGLTHMTQRLASLLAAGGRDTLVVRQGALITRASVRRGLTQPKIISASDGTLHVGEFDFTFRAPDPRKYGDMNREPLRVPGVPVGVSHQGNFDAHPVFELTDPPAAYSVASEFGTLTVSNVPAGGVQRLDTRTGRVTRNGVVVGVARGPLWTIPPGRVIPHTCTAQAWALTPNTYI